MIEMDEKTQEEVEEVSDIIGMVADDLGWRGLLGRRRVIRRYRRGDKAIVELVDFLPVAAGDAVPAVTEDVVVVTHPEHLIQLARVEMLVVRSHDMDHGPPLDGFTGSLRA